MKEWCLTHPYLTFIIVFLIIWEFEEALTIINNKIKVKKYELDLKAKEIKDNEK